MSNFDRYHKTAKCTKFYSVQDEKTLQNAVCV